MTPSTLPNGPDREPASAATKAEHEDARWASLTEKGVQEDQASRRRIWMIASVIVAGAVVWLFATT